MAELPGLAAARGLVRMGSRLSCRAFVELLADYLTGDLAPRPRAAFEAHLVRCPSCVNYTKTYREAVKLGKAALRCQDEPVPTGALEELTRAILAARNEAF